MTLDDLGAADEAFFSGTAVEITPIKEIDGRPVSGGKPGEMTRRLQSTFRDVVHGKRPEYAHWLSVVDEAALIQ